MEDFENHTKGRIEKMYENPNGEYYNENDNSEESYEGNDKNNETKSDDAMSIERRMSSSALNEVIKSGENQNEALESINNSYMELATPGVKAVERYCGTEIANNVKLELNRIDRMRYESLDEKESRGELSKRDIENTKKLSIFGIYAGELTSEQAEKARRFATNEDPEAEKTKVDYIYDAYLRAKNTKNHRVDGKEPAYYNEREIGRREEIEEKYKLWDKGEFDTERGFDFEKAFERLVREGGHGSPEQIRNLLMDEQLTLDDLRNLDLVREKEELEIGPFTDDDLQDIVVFTKRMYVEPNSPRYKQAISTIFQEIAPKGVSRLDESALQRYIAENIVQDLRPKAQELIQLTAATCLDFQKIDKPDKNEVANLKEYNKAKIAIREIGGYLRKLFYREDEVKKRFNTTKPMNKEFFSEVLAEANNLSEDRINFLDENQMQFLTKLNDWSIDLLTHIRTLKGDEDSSGNTKPSLFSDDYD
ncbi:hypothetical protein J5491_01660 [Candidatus Saccharibacteria bacterium]|nr:hypothetical protein [Candidatus Saccharibacteria bacterium]